MHLYYDLAATNLEKVNSIKAYGQPVWITEIGRPSTTGKPILQKSKPPILPTTSSSWKPNVEKVFWYELQRRRRLNASKGRTFLD